MISPIPNKMGPVVAQLLIVFWFLLGMGLIIQQIIYPLGNNVTTARLSCSSNGTCLLNDSVSVYLSTDSAVNDDVVVWSNPRSRSVCIIKYPHAVIEHATNGCTVSFLTYLIILYGYVIVVIGTTLFLGYRVNS